MHGYENMYISLIVLLLLSCTILTCRLVDANINVDDTSDHHHHPRRNLKRMAMLWTIERSPGFYFDFALASFIGSGADKVCTYSNTTIL